MKKSLAALALAALAFAASFGRAEKARAPLFRDFVGLNGHTVAFKPDLYAPVCRIVRDYHPVPWDFDQDTSVLPEWPFARNRVSWEDVYGSWHKAGLRPSVCLMIDEMKETWRDMEKDARAYAKSFAENFGPGGRWPYVEWVEIGNEPGLYSDEEYQRLFKAMAEGVREGNPRLKIATCNVEAEKSDRYWKGADVFKGLENLYDVIQIHRYAIEEGWPTWRRSYPENPQVPYLSAIQHMLDWRDANVPGKPLWVTEFGWDTSTQKPAADGEWAKWIGSTDEEQARYLVRSFLIFARMGVDKAFTYFFNDDDEPKLHAASGLTRRYQPKPAFHAVAWMLAALKDHRFAKAHLESLEKGYLYELSPEKPDSPLIFAAWHPTQEDAIISLPAGTHAVEKIERMPLAAGVAESVAIPEIKNGQLSLPAGQRPLFVWLRPSAR